MVADMEISQDLFTFAKIVSLFLLVTLFSHLMSAHKKQIRYIQEYILTNRTDFSRLLFYSLVLISAFYVIYYFISHKENPLSVLCIPLLYFLLKIISYDSNKDFLSPLVKGFSYGVLGIINIVVSKQNNTNDLTLMFFVSGMCFFESIDSVFEMINLLKKSLNEKNMQKVLEAPGK